MENFNEELIIKTKVQQIQFEQWIRTFYQLTYRLYEGFDPILQDLHYIKLHGMLTEGLEYAKIVSKHLEDGQNLKKKCWYIKLVNGFSLLKSQLTQRELIYIEYRRHNICHIFQNQYEHIQENYKIKYQRKGMDLIEIEVLLKSLLVEFGNDRNIDEHLQDKMKMTLTGLYDELG
jgi:hypothetical protein